MRPTWSRTGAWLAWSSLIACAAAAAEPPPAATQGPPPTGMARPTAPAKQDRPPDEALIEFLGDDDVPDAKWWAFMKRDSKPAQQTAPAAKDLTP